MDRRVVAVALLLVATSVGLAAAPPERILVVEDASTGERLLSVPVHDGVNVTLAYTHSVERTPVEDIYTVNGTRLDNTEMRFESYGWGLPAGADVRLEDGTFVFDPDRSYEAFYVQPGTVAGHELVVAGERHDLVALADGDAVRIAVERRDSVITL